MAPVTGVVANGEKHRDPSALGLSEGRIAPRVPVDRVVPVHLQVGTCRRLESVQPGACQALSRGEAVCGVVCWGRLDALASDTAADEGAGEGKEKGLHAGWASVDRSVRITLIDGTLQDVWV